ncbi:DUF4367 domain-containing protein [bacterium 210820-DFI.6.37]|nr:DUF4367 domain-containing protein [bacterium 210820-DFI.6.37]
MEAKKTHEAFKKAMQEAWEHVDLDKEMVERSFIPEPDLSFLEELELENNKLFVQPKRNYRLAKIAAFLLAVFLTSSAISLFMNSQASYGVKGLAQNVKHFFSENEPVVDEDGVQSLVLTDWKDLSDGKEIAGTLYAPSYIPEGYEFQEVSFDRVETMAITSYHFSKGKKNLYVDIKVFFDDMDVYVRGDLFQSPFSEKEMYFVKIDDEICITYAEGDHNFSVVGDLSKEEGTRIIEGIVEQE